MEVLAYLNITFDIEYITVEYYKVSLSKKSTFILVIMLASFSFVSIITHSTFPGAVKYVLRS